VDLSGGCGYCHSEQDLAALSGDVDAAPDDVVALLASDPSDHWSREQWQWLCQRFAPRLISLVRSREIEADWALRILGRHYAEFASWPDDIRHATEDALGAALVDALEHWPSHLLVDLLGGLACAYDDVRPWLARLDAATGPAARGGVIRLACYWAAGLLWQEDDWFGWWYTDDPVTPVLEWTLNAKARVEQFSQEHPECKTARDALIAIDRLGRGEGSPWVYPGGADARWYRWGLPSNGWLEPADQNN
jgi:hypothetical protein